MKICYMCMAEATSKEHAPPDSFFPPGHKNQLETVPSCAAHNNDNSLDVEYVRNILVSQLDTNAHARKYFADKVIRSYQRNSTLSSRILEGATPVILNDSETGIIKMELPVFNHVMESIAYARYYMDFQHQFAGKWYIFCPCLVDTESFIAGKPDAYSSLRLLVEQLPFIEKKVSNPEIFQYGMGYAQGEDEAGFRAYRFLFYEGVFVYVLRQPSSEHTEENQLAKASKLREYPREREK